jgi:formamidopyrimidine-DNA glycosylase
VRRRGKYILMQFSGPESLIVHLRMSGKLLLRGPDESPKYGRMHLRAGATHLHLVDPRALATVDLVKSDHLEKFPAIAKLGIDPLSPALSARHLYDLISKSDRAVKVALMDQRLLAGIGNIQATEALWHARIGPARTARGLSVTECGRLVDGIRWTLQESLTRERGPEIRYVSESKATNPFVVYRREGSPCPRCGIAFARTVIAGRGTVSCRRCQPDETPAEGVAKL